MKQISSLLKTLTVTTLCLYGISSFAETTVNKEDVMRFTSALAYVKEYSAQETNDQKLLENAISGMLKGLDAHSDYLNAEDYKALTESTHGEFAGLGMELTVENGLIKVVAPIDDTPAAKAGIQAGDYIAEINNKPVRDMTLSEAVNMMRGKVGSEVKLTMLRKSETKPFTMDLTRQMIKVVSVKSRLLKDGFGYLRISQFQEKTAKNALKAIANLEDENHGKLNGLILDLRNNPGGLLDAAVTISDLFLDSEKPNAFDNKIVYTEGRNQNAAMQAKLTRGDILEGAPMIVLINEGSASASEIVSGALQDYRRALILGKNSFGKGSVQTIIPLDKEHAIKLTTALYYTPAGRKIQAQGIKPDILVENLKIKETDALVLQPMRETDLKGHIQNDAITTYQNATDNTSKLAQEDYQLNEAVTVLKALHLANANMTAQLKNE